MASSRILKDVATIYKPLGEDGQGKMQWKKVVFDKVYFEASRAVADSDRGSRPSDSTTLYIFSKRSTASADGSVCAAGDMCEQLFSVVNNRSDSELDMTYLALFASESDSPPKNSLLVKSAKRFEAGSGRMWHWEVEAK